MKTARLLPFIALLSLTPLPASAQDNAQVMQRLDQLENDVQLLQRQVATGAPSPAGTAAAPADAASLDVQLSNLSDEIRSLRGQIEDNQHQIQKLSDTLDKLQKDTDFRFNQLAKAAPPPAAAAPAPAAPNNATPVESDAQGDSSGLTTAGDGTLHPPSGGNGDTSFNSPREHYDYAFRLLNQAQYPKAAASFAAFIKTYPKDPLVGNAWYWEGETYYIRHDYVTAADDFRQGFEALPDGPKAPDNLFKLALSLDAMNRDKEACVVLQQVAVKFKKSTPGLVQRANQEQKRIGCR